MNPVIADLLAAPEFANEASVMAARLDEMIARSTLTWKRAQEISADLSAAAQAGAAVIAEISAASRVLQYAEPQASKTIPAGF